MYADYEYYSSVYHGSTVNENDYTPYAEKAGAYINNKTDFIFEQSGPAHRPARADLCATENLQENRKSPCVLRENVVR